MPTMSDNFFLEAIAEGDKTDLTDDDLALLSSPSLIAYSDQSYSHYESDTLPSTSMQVPPAPSALPQLQSTVSTITAYTLISISGSSSDSSLVSTSTSPISSATAIISVSTTTSIFHSIKTTASR